MAQNTLLLLSKNRLVPDKFLALGVLGYLWKAIGVLCLFVEIQTIPVRTALALQEKGAISRNLVTGKKYAAIFNPKNASKFL